MNWELLLAAVGTLAGVGALIHSLYLRRWIRRGVFVGTLRPLLRDMRAHLDIGAHTGFEGTDLLLAELLASVQEIGDLTPGIRDESLRKELGVITAKIKTAGGMAPPGMHKYDELGNQLPEGPEWNDYRRQLKELSKEAVDSCTHALRRLSQIEGRRG